MALFFCLETKEPKIQVKPRASLRMGPYPAKRVEPGLETFTPCFAAHCLRFNKIPYALQPHRPPLFYPFFSEAVGLTKKEKII
jgi:hypothetical protein